jgi:hypothetical protein
MSLLQQIILGSSKASGLVPSGALGAALQQHTRQYANHYNNYYHMDKNTERGEWWMPSSGQQQHRRATAPDPLLALADSSWLIETPNQILSPPRADKKERDPTFRQAPKDVSASASLLLRAAPQLA